MFTFLGVHLAQLPSSKSVHSAPLRRLLSIHGSSFDRDLVFDTGGFGERADVLCVDVTVRIVEAEFMGLDSTERFEAF